MTKKASMVCTNDQPEIKQLDNQYANLIHLTMPLL